MKYINIVTSIVGIFNSINFFIQDNPNAGLGWFVAGTSLLLLGLKKFSEDKEKRIDNDKGDSRVIANNSL